MNKLVGTKEFLIQAPPDMNFMSVFLLLVRQEVALARGNQDAIRQAETNLHLAECELITEGQIGSSLNFQNLVSGAGKYLSIIKN